MKFVHYLCDLCTVFGTEIHVVEFVLYLCNFGTVVAQFRFPIALCGKSRLGEIHFMECVLYLYHFVTVLDLFS